MNQNIIFSDNEYYNNNLQQVEFQAQCQGKLITCIITVQTLVALNGQSENTIQNKMEQTALALFDDIRFDIEEAAEALIKQQAFNDDGHIYLEHHHVLN
jgi:hypothetical protein